MDNPYLQMEALEINLRLANCHPFELQWISQLLICLREVDDGDIMKTIGDLMYHPDPLDTWYLTVAMFLDQEELNQLQPVVKRITEDEDYFFSEFVIPDNAH